MAPVNSDVKWRCVIVCAILSVLLFERTVCVYTYDRKDCVCIRMIVRTVCVYMYDRKDCVYTRMIVRTVCIHV